MKINLLPADTYIVKNNTVLNNEDRGLLMTLYQPVLGATAINLYFTLWSHLDDSKILGSEYTHHFLMTSMGIKLEDILESREKLEAIGLLKTFVKKGSINNYIYELYSPLDAYEFLANPILMNALLSNIGKKEFKKLVKVFITPKIDLSSYENITSSFDEVFTVYKTMEFNENITNVKKVNKLDMIVNSKNDLNNVFSLIPEEMLNLKTVSSEIKELIYKLAFIYDLDDKTLSELIRNSCNEKRMIDKQKLRVNCSNYYTFEHKGKSPKLIYKNQPEYLRAQASDTSKKSKQIYTFETTSPYDFLLGKNKGVKPSKTDLQIIEMLLIDYKLNPGVVNVLVDYVLRINNNKLTKNFVLTIASQWCRSKIETVEQAMNISKKEVTSRSKTTTKRVKEKIPEWYNKEIETEEMSLEEINELEEKMRKAGIEV